MTNYNKPVTSREYKLILNSHCFHKRAKAADAFWKVIAHLVEEKLDGEIVKIQNSEDIRQTSYLDTPEHSLRRAGFIVRVRLEGKHKNTWKTTLKYRGPDRYLSASKDVAITKAPVEQRKFEEDVLAPFISRFSHSSWLETDTPLQLRTLEEACEYFPALNKLDCSGDTRIIVVNNFEAYEIRRKIGQFSFEKEPNKPLIVKACLSLWYLSGKNKLDYPLVSEFSCDYDLPVSSRSRHNRYVESFPLDTVIGTNRLFETLQNHASFIATTGTTKTAFAYDSM